MYINPFLKIKQNEQTNENRRVGNKMIQKLFDFSVPKHFNKVQKQSKYFEVASSGNKEISIFSKSFLDLFSS